MSAAGVRTRRLGLGKASCKTSSRESGSGTSDDAGSMSHFLQLLDDGINPAGPHQEDTIGQASGDVGSQFLAGQELFRQHGILGLNEANAPTPHGRSHLG